MKRTTPRNYLCSPSSHFSASCVQDFGIVNRYSRLVICFTLFNRSPHIKTKTIRHMKPICKTYDQQIWQTGTAIEVDSNETNQAGTGDANWSRSHDKLKTYLQYQGVHGRQTWLHDIYFYGLLPVKPHYLLITWSGEIM